MATSNDINPCVLLHGPESASISANYLDIPDLYSFPKDHVLLRIAYVGVCGSDVHFYSHGGVGGNEKKYAQFFVTQGSDKKSPVDAQHSSEGRNEYEGLVMGHEASATVLQTGAEARSLKKGDAVAIEPGLPCRKRARCIEGQYNLCFDMRFAASFYESRDNGRPVIKSTPGTLCKYLVLPESFCYELPANIELEEEVLVEPLAVGVHALRMASVGPEVGHRIVVVSGAGTIGLVCAALSCAFGASKVVMVDINEERLTFAREWLSGKVGAAQTARTEIRTFSAGVNVDASLNARLLATECGLQSGVDVVLEASGAPSATALGIHVLRAGGHMVQTGLSTTPLMNNFPIVTLSEKEIHLHDAFRYNAGAFELARDLLARGLVGLVKELINQVFDFERYEDAWKATRDREGIKNLIRSLQD